MSAGAFTEGAFYTTNLGKQVPIKLQPETLSATIGGAPNAASTGPADPGFPSAIVSGSKNAIGIHPRYVTCKLTGSPAGYKPGALYKVVVMSNTVFLTLGRNSPITYLSLPGLVVGTSPEKIN